MAVNLKGRSFLTLMDFTPEEIRYLLDLSRDLKAKKRAGVHNEVLKGKNVVLLFEKSSTRTRCAFEVACLDEGAHVTFLDSGSSQMGKKESLEDTAKVLGRFYDGIEYRGFKQKVVEDMHKNGLGYNEAMRKYEICAHDAIQKWERIYLEEGVEWLYIERRGRGKKTGKVHGRPPKLEKKVEEDLIAEVQRLRMENDYLKKLNALVQEKQLRERKRK